MAAANDVTAPNDVATAPNDVAAAYDLAARVAAGARADGRGTERRWVRIFAGYLPATRPLTVLDLGSGTGRYAPALAEEFGGPVWGVEPSPRQRGIARTEAAHPRVTYLDGRAELIPLPDDSCDLVLLSRTLHHVTDPAAAFAEIARVTAPGGRVVIRGVFADRLPDVYWHRFFPTLPDALRRAHRTVAEVVADAVSAGLEPVAFDPVDVDERLPLREVYLRVRRTLTGRAGPVPADEVAAGLDAMAGEAAVRGDDPIASGPADLLVLRRGAGP